MSSQIFCSSSSTQRMDQAHIHIQTRAKADYPHLHPKHREAQELIIPPCGEASQGTWYWLTTRHRGRPTRSSDTCRFQALCVCGRGEGSVQLKSLRCVEICRAVYHGSRINGMKLLKVTSQALDGTSVSYSACYLSASGSMLVGGLQLCHGTYTCFSYSDFVSTRIAVLDSITFAAVNPHGMYATC
jgi:hypothetical protein